MDITKPISATDIITLLLTEHVSQQVWERIGPHVPFQAAAEKAVGRLKAEEAAYIRARAERVIDFASAVRDAATPKAEAVHS